MRKLSVTAALATIAILLASPAALAQGTGQSAGQGTGSPSSPQLTPPPPPGTNSAGTAQSSGGRPNTGEGVTTGSANAHSVDQAIANENRSIDRRLKGICRGC
ncbi:MULTISPECIES: hypothetical protein [unclassified Bradyrhizobium]|uniref:hypothetical protein n=1 Tax=unclassified Bradyrhizobium TaxID=2631580 RepID=UPI002479B087|nr:MULTISPECIES: hypothetical protein [unclassified Bradyrhizobium]WGS23249.1 hypothetical protein MTX22_17385 [Bradyrhizobium sp. ISRA463]WGS30258.1 hypothetical protein MTX19_15120 [Bradyrhizobium sp. ISRA464]